ncbi:MAG: hypothetical protein L0312_27720, partial [Acidobacteria bacterium]|nr:hypothetical protein [Acidobacteriota bacterium]
MKIVQLGRKKEVAIVDDGDFARVSRHRWFLEHRKNGNYYAKARINGRWIRLHRFILGLKVGKGLVDHDDGDGLNDTRKNLIRSSPRRNRRNSKKYKGNSKFKGVWIDATNPGRRWKVCLHIGTFRSETEAARAYRRARRLIFGVRAQM